MASKTPKIPSAKPAPKGRIDPKLAARVVKLRDEQKKPWKAIEKATGKTPGQLRRLYNAGRAS